MDQANFHHEALLYRGDDEFVAGTVAFVHSALAAGAPVVLAILDMRKGRLLRAALGEDAHRLRLVDMSIVGRNPARLIPAWRDFVERHATDEAGVWGIGEPIWAGRTPEELVECHQHERLLNLAFADVADMRLLCPYDVENLDGDVIAAAVTNHGWLGEEGATCASDHCVELDDIVDPLRDPLSEPPASTRGIVFEEDSMYNARRFVAEAAERAGLEEEPIQDLLVAINELTTNSVRHGGGGGVLHVWVEDDAIMCQVRDRGRIARPPARPRAACAGARRRRRARPLARQPDLRSGAGSRVRRRHRRARSHEPGPTSGTGRSRRSSDSRRRLIAAGQAMIGAMGKRDQRPVGRT